MKIPSTQRGIDKKVASLLKEIGITPKKLLARGLDLKRSHPKVHRKIRVMAKAYRQLPA